ncbi:hypothetical protein [Ammoniphilus sp. YIM 78166]|uniref:hypothetical protein n=1 Tax=Ammoniphilus sp. YIM 78166 TaxID=1644106 RepID=UPI00106F4142|nr:hypothetical protein [Ammoniphilus sp. YIM 78166]
MNILKRLMRKWYGDSSKGWCILYIDTNSFRRDRVFEILQESGLEVKASQEQLLVKQEQYDHAMGVLKSHGY